MRVWVTRQEQPGGPLGQALEQHGLTPVHEPVVEQTVVTPPERFLNELDARDWLVLTSPYAIRCVGDAAAACRPRVAVVGPASAELARSYGMNVALVSAGESAHDLFDQLAAQVIAGRIVYPRSGQAPETTWPAELPVDSLVLYDTVPRAYDESVVEWIDVVAVTSPSAVRAVGRRPRPFASIGKTTTAALHTLGVAPWVAAPTPGFEQLAAAIAQAGVPPR